ncbi:MAG: heparin lyase I family protein [Myxococcales bacterium]|nr:heparin lyase I family protein [Myxococcales bacterium]
MPALGSVVWRGDFETGDLSQWSSTQSVSVDRLRIVRSPVRQGSYGLKATVRKGDDPIHASGNRNEVLYLSREAPGSEYYYRWFTLFPTSFPSANSWQLFVQWHQGGCCGSPPLELYVVGEQIRMRVGGSGGKVVWTAPLSRGLWHEFILHVKWSTSPSVGFVEMRYDGQLVLPKRMVATLFPGESSYLKMGLYRDASISPEGVVFHDGMVQATALEDVLGGTPPSLPAEETGVPLPHPEPHTELASATVGSPEQEAQVEPYVDPPFGDPPGEVTPGLEEPSSKAVPGLPELDMRAGCGAAPGLPALAALIGSLLRGWRERHLTRSKHLARGPVHEGPR